MSDFNLLRINDFLILKEKSLFELLNLFLDEYEDRVFKIGECIKDRDNKMLRNMVHKFKGVLLVFCTEEVVSIIIEFDNAIKNNQTDKYWQLYESIREKTKEVSLQMRKYMNSMRGR